MVTKWEKSVEVYEEFDKKKRKKLNNGISCNTELETKIRSLQIVIPVLNIKKHKYHN
jgi:hypothetical protein